MYQLIYRVRKNGFVRNIKSHDLNMLKKIDKEIGKHCTTCRILKTASVKIRTDLLV